MPTHRPSAGRTLAVVLAATLGVAGCNNAAEQARGETPTSLSVRYAGNTEPADITPGNAARLSRAVLGMPASLAPLGTAHMPGSGGVVAAARALAAMLGRDGSVIAARARLHPFISVMEDCDGGGAKIQTADSVTLTIDYFDCNEQGITINGSAARLGEAARSTTDIAGLRLTAAGFDLSVSGAFSHLARGELEILRLHDLVIVDTGAGRALRAEELVITETRVADGREITINGRLLDAESGALLIETADHDPLFFVAGDDYPTAGILTLYGADDESVSLMGLTSAQVSVEADIDGHGQSELDRILTWAEIEAGIDLSP